MYAVITGASSGIGLECAKLLARRGYDLILVARRVERLEKLKKSIEKHCAVNVKIIPCDLSDTNQCKELYQKCSKYPVEVLVNNAGFGKSGYFLDIDLEDEINMIDTNVKAVHILTKLFAKGMYQGYILNVASIAAFQPIPLMATYGASKAYVLNLSKAVNYEMKRQKKNVHVSTLCPGPVDTEFDQIANVRYSLAHISAKDCAKVGIQGMFEKRTTIFPILSTKMLSIISKLAPDKITLWVEYLIQNQKL